MLGIASRTAIALVVCAATLLGLAGVIGARTRTELERALLEERAQLISDVVARTIAETMAHEEPAQLAAVLDAMAAAEGLSGLAVAFPGNELAFAHGTVPTQLTRGDEKPRWGPDGLSITRSLSGGEAAGLVYIGLDLKPAAARTHTFAWTLALGLAAAVLVSATVIVLVVRVYISAPLRRQEAFARRLAEGDWTARPPDEEWPETRELSLALRTMADRLQHSHQGLERRVEERTIRMVNAERLAALGQMSAQLAHELRNPLNSVGGAVQYLRRVLGHERTMAEYGALIEDELARMNRFVDDLLRVARPAPPTLGAADVKELVLTAIRTTTLGRGVAPESVRASFPEDLPRVQLDRRMILEAVMNLLENAIDASGASPIEVEVRSEQAPDGPALVIEISDRGAGIPPELAARLGRPFITSKPSGTGLGLVIVSHAAGQHGGSFRLSPREGGGATATLRLPLRVAPASQERAA